uniref:Uncharacterized protein n=1 Tax=Solanum tuberosum TaxID=4113 RepID=M1DFV6_SOLTU
MRELHVVVHESGKDMILFKELEIVEYHDTLQTTNAPDGTQLSMELLEVVVASKLVPRILEKIAPMERLHEPVTHNCMNKDPINMVKDDTFSNKRKEVEDKEEEENDSNMQNIRNHFTWWNGRVDEARIFKRLDRVIANDSSLEIYGNSEVQHLDRTGFDHASLLVTCEVGNIPIANLSSS